MGGGTARCTGLNWPAALGAAKTVNDNLDGELLRECFASIERGMLTAQGSKK